MGKFSLRKEERLSRDKWIKELFDKGSSFYFYPFKVLYLTHPEQDFGFTQVLFSVSKRLHKTAVSRNRIKRRLREAYRLNKAVLESPEKLLIAYIYTAKDVLSSDVLHQKLPATLRKIRAASNENK